MNKKRTKDILSDSNEDRGNREPLLSPQSDVIEPLGARFYDHLEKTPWSAKYMEQGASNSEYLMSVSKSAPLDMIFKNVKHEYKD